MTIMYAANFFLCGIMMSLMIAGIIISAITPDMEKMEEKIFYRAFHDFNAIGKYIFD